MSFFGKKRQPQEKNLSLPDVSEPKQKFDDDIKFPEFPSYESDLEVDKMKSNEEEYRSTMAQSVQSQQNTRMSDTFTGQQQQDTQKYNYNFQPQSEQPSQTIPVRQRQVKQENWDPSTSTPDQNFSNFDEFNQDVGNSQQEPQPRYEDNSNFAEEGPSSQDFSKPVPQNNSDKPIFIKLENYKEVLTTIESIRKKIRDAESLLGEISRVRNEEDRTLESWKVQVESVKNRLLDIDRKLFE